MDLKLPHLGEGADSGTVVNLFVKEGDHLAKDQPVLELENEKAVATIPSTLEGVVSQVFVKPGDKINVGQRILSLGETTSPSPAKAAEPPPKPSTAARAPSAETPAQGDAHEEPPPPPEHKPGVVPAASPSIRKLAGDFGLDLSRIRGSERGGRIVLADVRAYIQRLQRLDQRAAAQPAPAAKPAAEAIDFSKWGPISKKPLSPLRQVIARRMAETWNAVPRVTQFDEADITGLMALRKQYAPLYEQKGARLTLTSFALKILSDMLKKHPLLNSSLDEAAQELVLKQYYHLGLAVDTEAGLIVPVIRDADKKDLLELSRAIEELAKKARDRKVSAEELKGGSFTLSNQGGIGGAHFTPIVNRPEVAILGLGRAALKPVVRDKQVEVRLLLPMALSYDHRVIDGGVAARFMVDLVQAFENFAEEEVRKAVQ
ncbi:Pyruvate dehydrogenase complex, dihydrolipoamide acyltransferase (E2) component [Verrucomicrobia bacterium]|nr:Pyruvate dehydrogenase complex, dihydrolipoamide acyltransferase (E2) component [Verrucomicrobiota bacterium]